MNRFNGKPYRDPDDWYAKVVSCVKKPNARTFRGGMPGVITTTVELRLVLDMFLSPEKGLRHYATRESAGAK